MDTIVKNKACVGRVPLKKAEGTFFERQNLMKFRYQLEAHFKEAECNFSGGYCEIFTRCTDAEALELSNRIRPYLERNLDRERPDLLESYWDREVASRAEDPNKPVVASDGIAVRAAGHGVFIPPKDTREADEWFKRTQVRRQLVAASMAELSVETCSNPSLLPTQKRIQDELSRLSPWHFIALLGVPEGAPVPFSAEVRGAIDKFRVAKARLEGAVSEWVRSTGVGRGGGWTDWELPRSAWRPNTGWPESEANIQVASTSVDPSQDEHGTRIGGSQALQGHVARPADEATTPIVASNSTAVLETTTSISVDENRALQEMLQELCVRFVRIGFELAREANLSRVQFRYFLEIKASIERFREAVVHLERVGGTWASRFPKSVIADLLLPGTAEFDSDSTIRPTAPTLHAPEGKQGRMAGDADTLHDEVLAVKVALQRLGQYHTEFEVLSSEIATKRYVSNAPSRFHVKGAIDRVKEEVAHLERVTDAWGSRFPKSQLVDSLLSAEVDLRGTDSTAPTPHQGDVADRAEEPTKPIVWSTVFRVVMKVAMRVSGASVSNDIEVDLPSGMRFSSLEGAMRRFEAAMTELDRACGDLASSIRGSTTGWWERVYKRGRWELNPTRATHLPWDPHSVAATHTLDSYRTIVHTSTTGHAPPGKESDEDVQAREGDVPPTEKETPKTHSTEDDVPCVSDSLSFSFETATWPIVSAAESVNPLDVSFGGTEVASVALSADDQAVVNACGTICDTGEIAGRQSNSLPELPKATGPSVEAPLNRHATRDVYSAIATADSVLSAIAPLRETINDRVERLLDSLGRIEVNSRDKACIAGCIQLSEKLTSLLKDNGLLVQRKGDDVRADLIEVSTGGEDANVKRFSIQGKDRDGKKRTRTFNNDFSKLEIAPPHMGGNSPESTGKKKKSKGH